MSRFHTSKKAMAPSHLNFMGGQSWQINDPLVRLRIAASSCFFGEPQYYHRDSKDVRPSRTRPQLTADQVTHLRLTLGAVDPHGWRQKTPSERMESAIDAALDHDAERTLQEAVRLRTEEYIRTTPQVILVRAAHHPSVRGTRLLRQYAAQIMRRADEPSVALAYQLWRYGKPIPNALKRALRDALMRARPYALAKYRMKSRAVKTVDVINLVHPSGKSVDALAKGTLKISKATGQTWESILSEQGSTRGAWCGAIKVMGHMALLRNLRNLLEAGLPVKRIVKRLIETAPGSKQLPFRYYSAYRAVHKTAPLAILGAIEDCLTQSLDNLPLFKGRVMSLCDNSGSARGTATSSMGTMEIAAIANLQAVLTGMRSEHGSVGVFGDRLSTFKIKSNGSLFKQVEQAERRGREVGMATENGIWLFWDRAIAEKQHWDHVFVYSDMQAGHGGLYGTDPKAYRNYAWGGHYIDVPKLIAAYRKKVNPKVHVHLVQVAGYQDTLVPEHYHRTTILSGWGDGLLRFAAELAHLHDGAQAVNRPKQ